MLLVIFLLAPLSFFLLCACLPPPPALLLLLLLLLFLLLLWSLLSLLPFLGLRLLSLHLPFLLLLLLLWFLIPSLLIRGWVRPPAVVSSALCGVPWAPLFPFFSSGFVFCSSSASAFASFRSSSVSSTGSFGVRFPAPAVPAPPPSLFSPFAVSESFVGVGSSPPVSASVSLAYASTPVVSSATLLGSASAPHGFASTPGPSSGLPLGFSAPTGADAPPLSAFAFAADDPFDPGFQNSASLDPEAPPPQLLLESVRAEIRRMYTYLVDLFLQAAGSPTASPPPHALFEEFFLSCLCPSAAWFPLVV